jgi:hypothetical protein
MFSTPDDLARAAGITREYEVENYLRHRRPRSGAGSFLAGAVAGAILGRQMARRGEQNADSGRNPQRGCW